MTIRVRSRGGFATTLPTPKGYVWNYVGFPPADTWVEAYASDVPLVGIAQSMTDTLTPGYWKKKMRGDILPTNPLISETRTVTVLDAGNGLQTTAPMYVPPRGVKEDGFWLQEYMIAAGLQQRPVQLQQPVFALSREEIADLITEVSTECWAKRGSAENDLFESVAEYRQAFDMLRHPIQNLVRVLTNPKRSLLLRGAKASADTWLMYRYGLMPLIRDITNIIEGLSKEVGLKRTVSHANKTKVRNSMQTVIAGWNLADVGISIQTADSVKVRASSYDEHLVTIANNLGFEAKGLETLAWELIPYSFVADWFVNAGSFLNALAPAPGFTQLASSLTIERDTRSVFTAVSTTLNNTALINGHQLVRGVSGSLLSRVITKARTALGVMPGLVIKSDFRFEKAKRVLDAFALAYNLSEGLFRLR